MIFYFTATGNSKYIAERIANNIEDKIYNLAECIKTDNISFELNTGEAVGFIVPVYYYGIPMIVTEFLQKLKITSNEDYYSYAVLNCGGTTGNAEKFINQEKAVKATYGIVTVDNYVPMYKNIGEENIKEQLDKADNTINSIIEHINNKDEGTFNPVQGPFSRLGTAMLYPMYEKGRKTKKFTVNEKCIGCGLCEKICPRSVIKIEEGKPVWSKPQCELCLGCLHRCPFAAINYGKKSEKNGRYINPNTKL